MAAITLVTEAQAREMWCHRRRRSVSTSEQWIMEPDTICIGHLCMAWRWAMPPAGDSEMRGYCGLAGEVESG